jgi:hypothetical protein
MSWLSDLIRWLSPGPMPPPLPPPVPVQPDRDDTAAELLAAHNAAPTCDGSSSTATPGCAAS